MPEPKRPLKVFLCHAKADKPNVRALYRYLKRRGIRPWLDEEDLVAGQDWQVEIPKALSTSDAIIICLTKNSVDKEGYIQKEIKFALDKALEMPEGRIFLIPVRFEECEVPFSLSRYQWVDLFDEAGYARMMRALKFRAANLQRAEVNIAVVIQPPKPVIEQPQLDSSEEKKEKTIEEVASEKIVPIEPEILPERPVAKVTENQFKPGMALFAIALFILIIALGSVFALSPIFSKRLFPTPTLTPTITATSTFTVTPSKTPTLTPFASSTSAPRSTNTTLSLPTASPSDTCNNATFISDITIPDGTIIAANQSFTKIWRIKNSGSCTWSQGYALVFIGGNIPTGQDQSITDPVAPGQLVDLSVTLTAPNSTGTYQNSWRLRDSRGIYFGAVYTVVIKVQ